MLGLLSAMLLTSTTATAPAAMIAHPVAILFGTITARKMPKRAENAEIITRD